MLDAIALFFEKPLAFLVLIILVAIGTTIYQTFREPTVYKMVLVDPECKEYTTAPLFPCKEGTTQNALLRCRCDLEWLEVTDEAEKKFAVDTRPIGYRVEY